MNLRSRMTLECKHGVILSHAAAVVGDCDQLPPTRFDFNANPRSTSVQRILEEFLDDGCRPLNNFARSDFVGDVVGEYADAAHWADLTTEPREAKKKVTKEKKRSRRTVFNFRVRLLV